MAARRLIFVMIVMLLLSTFAAALVPVERNRDEESSTTETTTAVKSEGPAFPTGGKLVEARIDAAAKRPSTVTIDFGDQLRLEVASPAFDEVEIPALGALEDVEPGSPAFFDLLPPEPGRYAVRLFEGEETVGWIVVKERAKGERGRDAKGSSGERLEDHQNRADDDKAKADDKARKNA